jgi:hypothetical protein
MSSESVAIGAMGHAAHLSRNTALPDGPSREDETIALLKKAFAAATSRFALSMKSTVWPARSTARYR